MHCINVSQGSLSSERLQYSAAPVQRVGTPSAGEDNQVCTTIILGIFPEVASYVSMYGYLMFVPLQDHLLIKSLSKN